MKRRVDTWSHTRFELRRVPNPTRDGGWVELELKETHPRPWKWFAYTGKTDRGYSDTEGFAASPADGMRQIIAAIEEMKK